MYENIQGVKSATEIIAEIEVTSEALDVAKYNEKQFEQMIQESLLSKISEEILNHDFLEVERVQGRDPYSHNIFRGRINIVKNSDSNQKVIINRNKYRVDGQDFSHQQIEEAILNTFPEYFL